MRVVRVAEFGGPEVLRIVTVLDGEPGPGQVVVGVDVAFDGVGGDAGRAVFARVASGGTYSNYGFAGGGFTEIDREDAARRGLTAIGMEQLVEGQPHRRKWALRVLDEAAAGRIRPIIGQTFPLESAAEAHAALENRGTVGKTLLLP